MEEDIETTPFYNDEKESLSVDDLSDSLKRFGALDYAVFVLMLACCSMVGLYFGYQDHMKHKRSKRGRRGSVIEVEAVDYLMGGRNMKVFPVAMSLVASFVSGITLLGENFCFIKKNFIFIF
jgi:Na+/pantothenate symporter